MNEVLNFLEKQYIVEYSNFSGNGDFSNVGAIELQFNGDQQIDVQFSSFSVTWTRRMRFTLTDRHYLILIQLVFVINPLTLLY
jgi:hypothetical protein